jgi:hypothetical protein
VTVANDLLLERADRGRGRDGTLRSPIPHHTVQEPHPTDRIGLPCVIIDPPLDRQKSIFHLSTVAKPRRGQMHRCGGDAS